jgi:predicted metal-dependent hydrolase
MMPAVYRATEPQFQDPSAAQLSLWQEGSSLPAVSLRHSLRARRIAVRIGVTGQVELVVPRGVSERRAWEFLESRAQWVQSHVQRRRTASRPAAEFPPRILRLPLLGESWRIFQAGGRGRPRLVAQVASGREPTHTDDMSGVLELRGAGTARDWRRCLMAWLKQRALAAFRERLDAAARHHGFTYSAVRVRCQRTRWGSCSVRGAISLNLSLLFQPADVVHYLLCHELAHTRHMNHSARFWRCVAACEPRWQQLDAALLRGWRNVPAWLLEKA